MATQREGSRALAAQLTPLGLTPSQAEVLRLLDDYGPLSLTGLGELLVCESGANPSRLVARLVDKGLIARSSVTHDARQVLLELTPHGHDLATRVRQAEIRFHHGMARELGPRDLVTLISALESLVHGTPAGQAIERRRLHLRGKDPQ
ncbi:MarR family winged helix-turn-helix transcriptional regulator [Microbacterium ulmi]|uniref:MarR family winged helix-turn-helix transcriptional regulator n=1 Tax=Microbacterium ulmi TaxID=179095 RepID=UPI001BB11A34|nr:MarR family transcriptional regulator [Microbacterium ulmi]NII69530.1 DNA-binding MarR family transcriptional regulator [Microbacterium ulmi]